MTTVVLENTEGHAPVLDHAAGIIVYHGSQYILFWYMGLRCHSSFSCMAAPQPLLIPTARCGFSSVFVSVLLQTCLICSCIHWTCKPCLECSGSLKIHQCFCVLELSGLRFEPWMQESDTLGHAMFNQHLHYDSNSKPAIQRRWSGDNLRRKLIEQKHLQHCSIHPFQLSKLLFWHILFFHCAKKNGLCKHYLKF